MDDLFTKKVRAAAVAGWWTILIVYSFLVVQWLLYLLIMSTQPSWLLKFLGSGLSWLDYQTLWLWGVFVLKLGVLLMVIVVIWLTIWGRKLARLKG